MSIIKMILPQKKIIYTLIKILILPTCAQFEKTCPFPPYVTSSWGYCATALSKLFRIMWIIAAPSLEWAGMSSMEKALNQKQRRIYTRIYLTLIHIKLISKFIIFISAIYTLNHVQVRTYTYRYDHNLQVPWQTPPQVLCGILLESNGEHLLMLATKIEKNKFNHHSV